MMRHRADVLISLGAAVAGNLCLAMIPLVERQIVDHAIVTASSSIWAWLVALVALALAAFGFAYLRRYRGGRVALSVQYDLRNAMHDHLLAMDAENLSRMPTGQLVARANSDSTLVQGLLSFFPIMSGNVLLMALSLAVMCALAPKLAVVSLAVVPALLVISYKMRWRIFPATWDAQQREGDLAQIVDEDVNGVRVVKAFGQERRELGRLARAAQALYGSQLRAVRLQSRYQPLLEAVPTIGQAALLALGGDMALHHDITLGTFLAFSTYLAQMLAPARQLAGVLTIGQQARAGVERIFQLLDLAPAIADRPGAVELAEVRGELDFDRVAFSYREGAAPVLDGLDLHLAPGERLALVGASASGKSTAAMLLARFYAPDAGTIRLDGHDLSGLRLDFLRRSIGLVFEDSFLFSASVRANIAYGRPGASDAEIHAAAKAAAAHEFIAALPKGYDTMVGERGLTLSGGQRQRIALARAILSDPAVLVLDDATSAIDAVVEGAIHDALRHVLAGRTTLLIAHRRSTLRLADRIAVLEAGRIVAEGSHEELMATSAAYRTLLAGLGGSEEEQAKPASDGATTASAWRRAPSGGGAPSAWRAGPSLGPGLGGGGGGWRLNLAPTPELLGRVAALRPVRDVAAIDLRAESTPDARFSLRRLLAAFAWPLAFGLVLVVIDAIAAICGPLLVKVGIDRGVEHGSLAVVLMAAAVYFAIALFDLLDEIAETFVTGRTAQRIMCSLRIRIWAQLQRLSLDYYEREMTGRIMTRMTTDVDQFESLIENGVLSALVSMVTFVGVGAALVVIDAELGLATLSVVLPLALATVVFRRRAARCYELSRERIAIVNADFQESLAGVREAQAFTHEAETRERFHALGRDYLDARVGAQRLVATYFPFVQFLSSGADAIVLGVGAGLVASHQLAPGALIAFILYIDLFFSPIQQLSQVFDAWQQTRVSIGRIGELMRLEPRTAERPDAVVPERLSGAIELEAVHFAYPAVPLARARPERRGPADRRDGPRIDAPVTGEALRGITLSVRPGETVALVGKTGAGKSTLVKLLARFYDPDEGTVRVDGHDLRELDLHALRSQLGYVPQEAFLFSGTVRDNIAYGRPHASDADVEAAARAVGAHEVIAKLPGGYLHEIAERGRSLSAGERQLIALARAQLVDPAILLLDEATSNLDLKSEGRVSAAMHAVADGRTTVLIAHRLQSARDADRIVVLAHGEVAESGSHDELVARNGPYAAMWAAFETANDAELPISGAMLDR
ncbi:MAG: ABC transporter ATP-binding protein [Actinomycetota bacterium]|nr:ABC transporter ATP-binding protein [Actinomycetota bacterium]